MTLLQGNIDPLGHGMCERALRSFVERFGRKAEAVALAPGRVNLIGDHTDYNKGSVLPMAISRWTAVAGARARGDRIRVGSALSGGLRTIRENEAGNDWTRYVAGVSALCREAGLDPGGQDLWIESSVPAGSGLSSSAALCVGVATLIETMTGRSLGVMPKAMLCQRVEHEYAGVPCGVMDQAVICGAQAGSAMLLDCDTLSYEPLALPESEVVILIADTGQSRALAGSAYADRRRSCDEAARRLGVGSLRELTHPPEGDDPVMRCARHVVTENARVLRFAEAIGRADWAGAGLQMNESHASLRDDFCITGDALDAMVHGAQATHGIYGARMTGAGMGGCAVALARADTALAAACEIAKRYRASTGCDGQVYPVRAVSGAAGARVTG